MCGDYHISANPRKTTYHAILSCFYVPCNESWAHRGGIRPIHKRILEYFKASGRCKMPCDIFCDNTTNFVGASNQLKDLKQFLFKSETLNEIYKYCSSDFVHFHFSLHRAPHFGGLWEAAVNSAKGLLNRTSANTKLTFELNSVAVTTTMPNVIRY